MNYGKIRSLLTEASPAIRKSTTVTLLFGLFLISSNWFGMYYKIQSEREAELDNASRIVENYAFGFGKQTDHVLKDVDDILWVAQREVEEKGRRIDLSRIISESGYDFSDMVQFGIVGEDGEIIAGSLPFRDAKELTFHDAFVVHKEPGGGLYMGRTVQAAGTGEKVMEMSRRINKRDGSFGGVVLAAVSPGFFTEPYRDLDLNPGTSLEVIGLDGFVRARQVGSTVEAGEDIGASVLYQSIRTEKEGKCIANDALDGGTRIYSFRVLPGFPLAVSVGMEEADVFYQLNQRITGYIRVAATNTAVIILFLSMLLRVTARQKQTEEELQRASDRLEEEVQQRTRELFLANQDLKVINAEHFAINRELQQRNAELLREIAERKRIEKELQRYQSAIMQKNDELTAAIDTLKQAQQQLIQQEKMASIGQLAAGVAHEINNPLGFVKGNVEMLEEYCHLMQILLKEYQELGAMALTGRAQPAMQERLNAIAQMEAAHDLTFVLKDLPELFRDTMEGIERMSKIVKEMRVFSHLRKLQIHEPYDMNQGLRSALIVAQNEIKHCATVECRLGDIPVIEADGGEINQVLLNLIVNAAQAIKGRHQSELGLIQATTWHDERYVYCSIEDSGIGMDEEQLKNIFVPFFTTKPVGQGTGLGLSISYDIVVQRHNGGITVESDAGKGSKFIVALPRKQERTGVAEGGEHEEGNHPDC